MSDTEQQNGQSGQPGKADEFKKTSAWARPIAMARDSNVYAWLGFIGLICLCIALWGHISRAYWQVRNRRQVEREQEIPRTANCFLAISYEGVSHLPDPSGRYISTEAFRSHLMALIGAGYHPIGLQDICDFYYDNRLLPDKAVLLTFENTRKSTYFETRPILDEVNWRAVMGVVTKKVGSWDNDVILRPYLKTMALDARWDLASESHEGTEFITVTPQGRKAPFFSSLMWDRQKARYESLADFKDRIEKDHQSALAEFEGKLGTKPLAFFFPLGNYGQFDQSNRLLRESNLEAVSRHYKLGFILNNQALNEATTDRRRLNRTTIPADMTPEQLVALLDSAWPFQSAQDFGNKPVDISRWVSDWGLLDREAEAFTLRAKPAADQRFTDADATIGARAWLSGSSQLTDGTFETRFELIRGELHVYLRYRSDDDWTKVAVTEGGRVTIGQSLPGEPSQIVASDNVRSEIDFRTAHNFFITLRGDLIYVRLDGEMLFGGPVRLQRLPGAELAPGLIGISVQGDEPGLAQSHIRESYVRPRVDNVITWTVALSRDQAYVIRQLNQTAFRYTLIAPPWLDVNPSVPISFPAIDHTTLRVIANGNQCRIFPMLSLHAEAPLSMIDKSGIIRQLIDEDADGVLIDAGDFPVERLSLLKSWLDELDMLLTAHHLGLAVRFPSSVAHLAAVGSSLRFGPDKLLIDGGEGVPPGVDRRFVLGRLEIPPPASDEDISLFFQLSDYDNTESDALPEVESLRRKGLSAYATGDYATATNYWTLWRDADPGNPEAWAFLGNAFSRLPDVPLAIDAYKTALRLNPGQVELMLECARLLETSGKIDKAAELIDTYARAFPENAKIAVAQANWLERRGKRSAGRDILSKLIARNGNDINSRLALHSLLDSPEERYQNMHELLKIGNGGPSRLLGFGHDIASSEILTMPESSVFFDFIRDAAQRSPSEAVRTVYSDFLPPMTPTTERFDASRLSDNWEARGTTLATIAGAYNLQAASDMAEAFLRLRKSELIRDGFIEVHLGESVGAFWLYARRSAYSMIRFGFNDDGHIRIQSWKNGDIRTGDSASWIRPSGDIVLRLELRGDGAMGYVDGRPMFTSPLMIPRDIAYGWWSIAPYSPELGSARARIGLIAAGPLSPGIAIMREFKPEKIVNALDSLRPRIRHLSAIAPVLFEQAPDGSVLTTPLADFMPFRMFCSYHCLRLMPAVSLDYYSDVNPETLIRIIDEHHLAGLVLIVRTMPEDSWFEQTTKLLETTSANLIVIQREAPLFSEKPIEPDQTVATVREIQRGSLLIQPSELSWKVNVQDYDLWNPGAAIPSAKPQVVVMGGAATLARELAATNAVLLSVTNALPSATNAVPAAATNAAPSSATSALSAATGAVFAAVTNAIPSITNVLPSAKTPAKNPASPPATNAPAKKPSDEN